VTRHYPALDTGNTIPEPHTEDGIPDWAIGVLVAASIVTVLWFILLVALVSQPLRYAADRQCDCVDNILDNQAR